MPLLDSIKDKMSRKSPVSSRKTDTNNTSTTPLAASPAQGSSGPSRSRNVLNPFSNPSPATRRPPPAEAPPPAYSETPTTQTGPSYPSPNPDHNTDPAVAGTSRSRGASPAPSALSAANLSTPEDPYAFLTTFDTVFVIDDSGSMAGSSWREVREALRAITPICTAHDSDGIDVFFLNHKSSSPAKPSKGSAATGYRGITDAAAVERLFASIRPGGGTPTGTRLHNILKPYLQLCAEKAGSDALESVKPINIIVITDGVPSDDVESVLLHAAKKLDAFDAPPYQVGVQFFQVGNEPGAREALEELDDGLCDLVDGGVRDMVDTVTWSSKPGGGGGGGGGGAQLTANGILKAVLGAVVKRLDRRRASGESRRPRHLAP